MNRLKELRESRKELQSEVAERIGVSRQAYGLYETGKRQPDLETLNKNVRTLTGIAVFALVLGLAALVACGIVFLVSKFMA